MMEGEATLEQLREDVQASWEKFAGQAWQQHEEGAVGQAGEQLSEGRCWHRCK